MSYLEKLSQKLWILVTGRFGLTCAVTLALTIGCDSGFYKLEPDYDRVPRSQLKEQSGDAQAGSQQGPSPIDDDMLGDDYGYLITYADDIQYLLEDECVSCHGPEGEYPDLSDYQSASEGAEDALIAMENGSMPPDSPVAAEDLKLFQTWMKDGLLEYEEDAVTPQEEQNTETPETPQDTSEQGGDTGIGFAAQVSPILEASCAANGCHNTASATAGYDFASFDGAAAGIADGIASIESGDMPIGNFPAVSAADLQLLKDWLDAGTPP